MDRQTNHRNRRSDFLDGRFAIGITIGIFVAIAAYLLTDLFALGLSREEVLTAIPSLLALLVALVSLLISYSALSEQRMMRQAGTDPVILVHLDKRKDAQMLTTFEISNVGAGAAQNVRISVDKESDFFTTYEVLTDLASLSHPIRAIPQGKSISFNFGIGFKLLGQNDAGVPVPPFEVTVAYEDIEGTPYVSKQAIDVRELHQQSAHQVPSSRVAASLERLASSVSKIADSKNV